MQKDLTLRRYSGDKRVDKFVKAMGKRGGKRGGYLMWCRVWANSIEGRRRLLKFVYSEDESIALSATLTLYAYAYGKPSNMQTPATSGVAIDFRQYEGPDGAQRLKEDIQKELAKFKGPIIAAAESDSR